MNKGPIDPLDIKITWDRERVADIVNAMLDDPDPIGIYPTTRCFDKLTELLGSVRAEAIGWTWTEACSQYDRGMDPRRFEMPLLLTKATADLNPERK